MFGLGTSPDNGVNFHVFLTFDGLNFDADDIDNIWNNGTSDRVKKEVDSATAEIPDAIAKAQDAVNRANSAVANSKVNSDAIKAMESAAAEAKSGADQAIKDAQAAIKNVASDAAAIKQNVANVESQVASAQSANAAAVQQLNNDLSTAKQNIATANANLTKAQSAIDDNKKAIADSVAKINSDIANDRKDMDVTRTQLSSAQDAIAKNRKDLESNVADINSEIAQDRKGIAAAQQANADTAKQLGDYAKQAAAQGKTIKSLQDDDNSTKLTIADIKGNVSQVQDSVSGLSASLKDTQGNLATVKALADSLNATMTDHGKSIAALQATAQSLSSTLSDADGRLSKVEQTAKSQSTTLSTMQGNLSQVKQEADSLTANLKDTQGDIAKVQATAKGLSEQITTAQGAITALQTDVSGIKATIADHDKNIHTLQATAKSLTDSMADAQGNISKLQATAAGLTSKFTDQSGRLSKVEQTAAEHSTTISNLRSEVEWKQVSNSTLDTMKSAGHFWGTGKALTGKPGNIKDTDQVRVVVEAPSANSVSQTLYANGLVWQRSFDGKTWSKWVRSANQGDVDTLQGSITQVKQTAAGLTTTIHDAQNNIAQIQTTAKGLSQQIESAQGDIANLTKTATGLQASLADHSKRIATVEARADKLESDMKDAQGNITTAMQTASAASVTASDAKSNAATAVVTASGTKTAAEDAKSDAAEAQLTASQAGVTAKDAKSDVMTVTATASDAKMLATNANSQAMEAKAAANQVTITLSGVEETATSAASQASAATSTANQANTAAGKAQATADSNAKQIGNVVTTVSTVQTNLKATQTELSGKADKATVDNTNKKVSDLSGQVNVIAGQVKLAAAQSDVDELKKQSVKQEGQIQANANGLLSKADKTVTDALNHTVQQQQAQQQVLADQVKTKVTSSDVQGILANGHYATQAYTQSIVNQTSQTLNSNITEVKRTADSNHQADVTRMTNLQQSIDGIQGVVKNKADQSTVTQLADTYQVKLTGTSLANVGSADVKWTKGADNDYIIVAYFDVSKVKPGTRLDLEFDYTADAKGTDCDFMVQLDGTPWTIWGEGYTHATKGQTGHYRKIIVAGDWSKDGAKHIALRTNKWKGTLHISNLTLTSGENVQTALNMLTDDVNMRVQKGDLLSQINLEAGRTLFQSKKIFMDADSIVFGPNSRAFIPSAAIVNLDASKITFYGAGNTYATMGAGVKQFDDDKQKSTINLQYNGGVEVHASNQLGSIFTMHDDTIRLAVKSQVYGSGSGQPVNQQYSGVWFGSNFTLMNTVDKEGKTTGWAIGSNKSDSNKDYRAYLYDNSTSIQPNYGVGIGTTRFDVYAGNSQLFLGPDKAELRGNDHATVHGNDHTFIEGGDQQIYMHNGEIDIGNPNNIGSATGVHLQVFGWATYNGYVEAMGFNQKSTLSSKTRIQPLDTAKALATINATDLTTFQYKTEIAEGMTKRHAGPIIDDVHDVAQYQTPDAFVAENRQGRSDGDIVGFLMGAVQELSKQLNELKEEVKSNE